MENTLNLITETNFRVRVNTAETTVDDNGWEHHFYTCTAFTQVDRLGRMMDFTYRMGLGHDMLPEGWVEDSIAAEMLNSLVRDAESVDSDRDLAGWLFDMGYVGAEEDLRRGFTAYEACKRTHDDLVRLFDGRYSDAVEAVDSDEF